MRVLIVDDDRIIRIPLKDDLMDAGYEVRDVGSAEEALAQLEQEPFDVIVTDLRMPGMDGVEFLEQVKAGYPGTEVIMMTAYGTVKTAVEAMKRGAYEYLTKPFDNEELLLMLDRLRKVRTVMDENVRLRQQIREQQQFHRLVGKSPSMQDIFRLVEIIGASDSTVLICGETGTGKELIAHAIHEQSARREGRFVAVSCAALSRELLESELFGHERGAFTGAVKEKIGKFQLANGGTIFLDEVDDIPLELQVKLLRVLQDHQFERVGGTQIVVVDLRVIAATKVHLQAQVQQGRFRQDLYYRLNVVPMQLPPLRDRKEDIPLLIHHFLEHFAPGRSFKIHRDAMKALIDYAWPGNVRELENVIERWAVVGTDDEIKVEDLPVEIRSPSSPVLSPYDAEIVTEILRRQRELDALIRRAGFAQTPKPSLGEQTFSEIVASTERDLIEQALEQTRWNQTRAAELLGLKLSTFRDKLVKLGLDKERT